MKRFTSLMLTLLFAVTAWAQSNLRISDGLLATQENGQYKWTSAKMTLAEGDTKLRIAFLETSNNEKPAGFPCVAIAEFYLYDKNGVAVTLTEANFSSNATQGDEGKMSSICDGFTTQQEGQGAYDWYWHSQWSGTPNPYGYHYLEVDLTKVPDGTDLSEFSFGWVTRRAQASPADVIISTGATTEQAAEYANNAMMPKVSTDIVTVYTIKSVRSKKYLTYSAENAKPQQNNNVTNEGYWYFTEGAGGKVVMHNVASGKVLGTNFEMSTEGEWKLLPAKYRPGFVISQSDYNGVCIDDQSGSIGQWSHSAGDNEGTTWLIEEASVDFAMLSLQSMKIASIGEAVTELAEGWYILNNAGRNGYVSQEVNNWKMRGTGQVAAGDLAREKAGYLFKITKNGEYYNIISGNGKYFQLGRNTASTSATPVNFEIGKIGESTDIFYLFDKDHGYVADGQEVGNAFVGWAESVPANAGGNDSYRLLPVELVDISNIEKLKLPLTEAIANAQALYEKVKNHIGEGLGQYTAPANFETQFAAIVAFRDAIDENTTAADVEAKVAELEALVASFKLNMPATGKYYYLKNCNTGKYLSNVKNSTLAVTEEKGANNIFYFESDGEDEYLLSYGNGNYVTNPWNIGVGAAAIPGKAEIYKQKKEFVAGNLPGAYALKYYADNGSAYYFTASGSSTNAATDGYVQANGQWTIEEVTSLPVSITAAGYATFFAPVAVTVADGVTAYTVKVDGDVAKLNEIGATIPANTGVVLAGEMGAYDFVITTTTATVDTDLEGTAAATYVADDAYVLGIVNDEVGFYTATKNQQSNTSWLNNSHKAYLPKPVGATAAYYSFRFGEGTTGVENVDVENEVKAIYDLTGRRVEAITAPGIYIINGKKTLVK